MNRKLFSIFIAISFICVNPPQADSFHGNQVATFNALSIEADPQTGSAGLGIPIAVPTGRGGIQPNLQLQYNSNLPNGIFGVGWTLELGSIQRGTKNGPPKYDDTDTYILMQNGAVTKLVFDSAVGFYRAEQEGAFMKIKKLSTHWVVTDKSGTKYHFGEGDNSLEYDPANTSKVFKWCLNRVEDMQGNEMTINYFKDKNRLYPENIHYTANNQVPTLPFAHVEFKRELRPDTGVGTYINGYNTATDYRVTQINVYVDTALQRRYELSYTQSNATYRSLLTSVTQVGNDGFSTLPSTVLNYQEYITNPAPTYSVTTLNNGIAGDNRWVVRWAGGYNTGSSNHGPVPPGSFGVSWGGPSSASSGTNGTITWNVDGNGKLDFSANQDSAYWMQTWLYVDSPTTLNVDYTTQGVDGVWLNNIYSHVGKTWSLNAGYNFVEMTFYNQNQGFNFDLNYALATNVDLMSSSQQFSPQFAGDFDGDGMTDLGAYTPSSGKVEVALSQGSSFQPKSTWHAGLTANGQVLSGNFDNDGILDIVVFDSANGNWRVGLSTGGQFNDAGTWLSSFGAGEKPSTGDFDGDGLTDIVTFVMIGGELRPRYALNVGGSFQAWSGTAQGIDTADNEAFAADFNGDGIADFGTFNKSSGTWRILANPGDLSADFPLCVTESGFGGNREMVVADFNMDGLTDIGYYDEALGKVIYKPLQGAGFGSSKQIDFAFVQLTSPTTHVQSADFNGDGLADFMAFNDIGNAEIAYSDGDVPDLLSSFDNGAGATTSLTYKPSTQYTNSLLPFVVQTVSTVTHSNNRGDNYTTNYFYSGGLWSAPEREFRGFSMVRITDSDGNYAETDFLQDDLYKGRIAQQSSYGFGINDPFSKTIYTWSTPQVIVPGSTFIFLARKDNFVYDGDATGRRTAEEFFYEEPTQYGNLTKAVQLGEVELADPGNDIPGDSRTVETTYVNDSNTWLLGLPVDVTVKDTDGAIVRRTYFFYDNNSNYTSQILTAGLLTKKEDWAGDGPNDTNPVTQYTYDNFGNLKTTIDPLNNMTTIDYDSVTNIFPIMTSNAMIHQVANEYYGVNEIIESGLTGLWGQLKATTDPNDETGKRAYDTFGRPEKTISPLDSVQFPTVTTEYQFSFDHNKIITRQRAEHGMAKTIDVHNFYDGFGRLIQTKTPTNTIGQYVVSSQSRYNSRGLTSEQYLPDFSTNSVNAVDVLDTAKPHTLITYDAMGRVIETINPDGSRSNIAYDDWSTSTIDANGHKQESVFDAYGRLIEKREFTGADGRGAPTYPQTPFTLYAVTQYEYDSEGNLINTIDAHGNTTTITYDKLGRKIAMDDPDMGVWQYEYDLNGNLTKQTDAKQKVINFTYDALNRLTNKTDGGTLNVNYTYDDPFMTHAKGRLTKAQYGLEETGFEYDKIGREIQSIKKINSQSYGVGRNYDSLNNLLNIQYPDGKEIFYKYNPAGQIESVSNDASLFPETVVSPPELDTIEEGNLKVRLTWSSVAGASEYTIHYGSTAGNHPNVIPVGNATMHIVSSLNNGELYYFVVTAADAGGVVSANSNERSASPTAPIPIAVASPIIQYKLNDNTSNVTVTDSIGGFHGETVQETDYTPDLANGGTASASSCLGGCGDPSYSAAKSFDNVYVWVDGWVSNNTKSGWIAYDLPSPAKVSRYRIYPRDHANHQNHGGNPESWTFEGFTGTGWDVLDSRSFSSWVFPNSPIFTFNNDTAYQKYRINISSNGGHEEVGFTEMEMMGFAPVNTNSITTAGKVGNTFNFNGTYRVNIEDMANAVKFHNTGSMSFWVKSTADDYIIAMASSTSTTHYSIHLDGNVHVTLKLDGSVVMKARGSTSLTDGLWHHAAIVQDGAGIKLYVDGVQETLILAQGDLSAWINDVNSLLNTHYLGGAKGSNIGNAFFNGSIDDFRYYNFPLTPLEVDAIYNDGVGTESENPQYLPPDPLALLSDGAVSSQLSAVSRQLSDVSYQLSAISRKWNTESSILDTRSSYRASSIEQQVSSIQHPESSIEHPASSIQNRTLNLLTSITNFYTQWFEPNILGIKPAYAEDSWVFVRLEDRPGTTLDDDKGRSKRGDIIQVVPAVAGEEPTNKEKAEYAIFVVSDIALADKKSYQESHWEEKLDEYGNLIPVKKAFRNKKYKGLQPGTKRGFHKNSKIKNKDFKKGIRTKTQFDYLSYSLKSRFYAYAQKPMIRLADIITPKAQAADDISKICAVGPNCTDEDYNTLAAWEDANDGDLVTAQTRKIAEVYNDDGSLSGGVLIDGSTTNSSYYMVIRAPAGERHSGTKGTGVVINGDPTGESVIQLDDNYPRIEWIECDGSGNSDALDSGCIGTTLYGGHLTGRQIKNVLVYDSVDHGIYMTGTALLYNSFIFNNADTGVRSSYSNDTLTVVNTTSYNNGNHGFYALNSSQNIDNCISMANGGLDYGESKGTGNFFNVDYSMSSDGTADNWSGTGVLINQTTADQFVSTTLPNLHLKAGSNAIDVGIDLGAGNDIQIDIDGWDRDTQGDVWDMGADETGAQSGLSAPTLNSATAGDTQVILDWTSVSSATGYKVKYGTSSGVYGAPVDVGNVTSYTVAGLTNGTTYYFVVTAYDATEESIDSNEKSAVPVAYNVGDDLIAAYDFEESSGNIVNDISGYLTPANLLIGDAQAVTWISGGLSVDSSTILQSSSAPAKIIDALQASSEMTLEVWVKPANITQSGPARMVSFSQDTSYRNFTFGQTADEYVMRLRTTNATTNGLPETITSSDQIDGSLQHVVFTHDSAGNEVIYVDGQVVTTNVRTGDFSNWESSGYLLTMANEATLDRSWLGTFYHVSLYDKSLLGSQVLDLYNQGLPTMPLDTPLLNTPSIGDGQVDLSWNAVTDATGYKVKYGTSSGVYGAPVDVGNVTSYTVSGLTNDTTYYFVVSAYDATEESVNSNEESATPVVPPVASTNLASGIIPTTNNNPVPGNGNVVTDGIIITGSYYNLDEGGVIWIQLDLGAEYNLTQLKVWHYFGDSRTYHDVIFQVSTTSDFSSNVVTVFNNDTDNSAGLGIGTDSEYVESSTGKTVDFANTTARYVRLYSQGSSINIWNHYVEVEAWGTPGEALLAPTLNSAVAGDGQADLSWNAVTDATGYKVKYGTSSGVYGAPVDVGNVTSYTVSGLTNDTTYYFVVSAYDATEESVNSNEESATPVVPPPSSTGTITYEIWEGIEGGAVSSLTNNVNYPDNPTQSTTLTSFEGWTDWGYWYGSKISGFIHPPASGDYTFWIASDDGSALYISTNDDPANKQLVASVSSWTSSREWNKYPEQKSIPISLVAGQKYYIEALHKEGSGGDNLAVAWQSATVAFDVIAGQYLSPANNSGSSLDAPVLNLPMSSDGEVNLDWNTVTDATGYKVKYGTASGIYGAPVDVGNMTSHTVIGLTNDTTYYFVVTAYDATEESADSNEESAMPTAPPPPLLVSPILNPITAGDTQADLTWNAVSGAAGYKIKYGTTSGGGAGSTDFTQDPSCVAAWKLDETTGAVIDSCGVNNGTVLGALTQGATGQYDNGIEFFGWPDGNNTTVNFGSAASLDNLSARTMTAWIYPHSTGDYQQGRILSKNEGDGWTFRLNEDSSLAFSQAFSGGVVVWKTPANSIQFNIWQHVAVTYAGTGVSDVPILYINGVPQSINNPAPFGALDDDAPYDLKLGIANTTYEFDGVIDEVAIFKRILTQSEINEIKDNRIDGGLGATFEFEIDAGNITNHTVTGLINGTTYYFVVAAYNLIEEGPDSDEESVTPTASTPLAAPLLNTPSTGDGQIGLSWNAVGDATGYKVKYGIASGVYGAPVDVGSVTSHSVTGLINNTKHYFVVTAYSATEESSNSNEKNAIPFSGVIDPQLFVTNVQYNASGQVTQMTYGNGTVTTNTYDPLNLRLKRIYTVDALGAAIQDLNYIYDPIGNILSITDNVNTADQTFQYDEQNRLVQAVGETYGIKDYAYDEVGNIISKDALSYTYGEGPAGPHAVTSRTDGTTFTYDANGNMQTKQAPDLTLTEYIYDVENRLVKVKKDGLTIAQYEYDGDGGRTTKTTGGVTTKFIGSLYEHNNTRTTNYVFFGDQRIASITNGNFLYYHGDHLGGTNVTTDFQGTQKELIEYEPFGTYARHDKPVDDIDSALFYFTGKRIDDETGLYYYGARYYDPDIGRFITPDTIVPYPSDPQSFNRYSYVRNNPVNLVDPTGHFFKKLFKAFKKAFGGGVGAIIGATIGGFIGAVAGGVPGAIIGAYVGAVVGGAVGTTIQHGGNFFNNLGNSFLGSLPVVAGAGVGFALGGPGGAIAGAIGAGVAGSAISTLARGGSLEDAAIAGIVTAGYAAIGSAYYKAIGSKVISKGVEIHNARAAGAQTPIGADGKNTRSESLSVNKGKEASNGQALRLKPNYDVEGKIVSYDLVPEKGLTVYRQGTFAKEGWAGNTIKGQQWSPENPLSTPNYAQKYGLPLENSGKPNWVIRGTIHNEYGTRPAPSSYNNPNNTGGATEILPNNPNNVQLDSFHMP